jgi:hypothetical protein
LNARIRIALSDARERLRQAGRSAALASATDRALPNVTV